MISIFNPLKKDFTVTYDTDGDSNPKAFTVKSLDVETFDNDTVGHHVLKHLADAILNERGVKTNHADDYRDVINEITI